MLDAHREEALAAVRRAVGNVPDAEDCIHDAMLRLVQRSDLDAERVHSLLARAAAHIAIDRHRSRQREDAATARLRAEAEREVAWPEQVVVDRADAARVLRAVQTLPQRERQVMWLRLVAGMTVAETARLLGVSYKSIEGTYTRARARIRAILGTALAWLAAQLRRVVPQQSSEPLAAAAAVVVVLVTSPLWHNVVDAWGGSGGNADGAKALADGPPTPVDQPGGVAAPSLRSRLLADWGDRSRPGSNGADGDGRNGRPPVIFTTGPTPPFYNPYTGHTQSPGTLLTITGPIDLDPVGDTERCVQEGGPTETVTVSTSEISVVGGCPH